MLMLCYDYIKYHAVISYMVLWLIMVDNDN